MLLEASYSFCTPQSAPAELRHAFNAASFKDTFKLGKAFAEVLRDTTETPHLRIGVVGDVGSGKTALIQGLLSTIQDLKQIETVPPESFRTQALWHSERAGWLRHYDAMIAWPGDGLECYLKNDVARCTPTLVDLAEHPASDIHNKMFNYMAFMEWGNSEQSRIVTIVPAPANANSAGLKKFLSEAQPLRLPKT